MDTYFNANILTGTGLLAPDVNHKKIRAFLQELLQKYISAKAMAE